MPMETMDLETIQGQNLLTIGEILLTRLEKEVAISTILYDMGVDAKSARIIGFAVELKDSATELYQLLEPILKGDQRS